jgi:hypothetical protein
MSAIKYLWNLCAFTLFYNARFLLSATTKVARNHSSHARNIGSQENGSLPLSLDSNVKTIPKIMHKESMKAARDLLSSGKCKHIYLDLGTNVGIQIRKLFQPLSYPKSYRWTPIWDANFGKYDIKTNNRSDVCAFGFEPNPQHNIILKKTEKFYQNHGFNVIMFRETAVSTIQGNATFFRDLQSQEKFNEWGSSMLDNVVGRNTHPNKSSSTYSVLTLDMAKFVSSEIGTRKGITSSSRIVAKMDIEGAEYTVLPAMLAQSDCLCSISYVGMEWHTHHGADVQAPHTDSTMKVFNFITKQIVGCRTKIAIIDDETYGFIGEDTISLDHWT